jgi:hypothetical protein
MNEAYKKFLTEKVLGEKWPYRESEQRTFKEDTDVFDLMRKLVETGKWGSFEEYASVEYREWSYTGPYPVTLPSMPWLFLSVEPDGVRTFAKLAGELPPEFWDKENEK